MKKSLLLKFILGISILLGISFYTYTSKSIKAYADDSHYHNEIGFVEWDSTDMLPSVGNYYLKNDVHISFTWKPDFPVCLCLNGHGIIMTGEGNVIDCVPGGKLIICDCGTQEHKYQIDTETGLAHVDDTLTENYETFTGGYITGGNGSEHGGGIYVKAGDYDTSVTELYMHGGTIIGNKTTGNGGAIYYAWASKKNSLIELENVSIIGNGADDTAGGIYHGANNRYLKIKNSKIKNNVSTNAPAGIYEESELHFNEEIYVYDNFLKDGKRADISISHTTQNDKLIVDGNLGENSKIGFYKIRRELIYDFYKYYDAVIDVNTIFVSNTFQRFEKDGTNAVVSSIAKNYIVQYDGEIHTFEFGYNVDDYDYTIKFGTEEGTYNLDAAPEYKEIGDYTIYYEFNSELGTIRGKQNIKITKAAPVTPLAKTNLYYTGESQELIDLTNAKGVDTFQYKIEGGYWSSFIPKGKEIQEYVIYVRCYGDEHYLSIPTSIEVKLVASIIAPDKTRLNEKIDAATAYYEEIKDSYTAIASELNTINDEAKNLKDNEKATLTAVDNMVDKLDKAINDAKADVKVVDDNIALINDIGEVTFSDESKAKIDAARQSYDALTEKYQVSVLNYETLTNAENTYNTLKANALAAQIVIDEIDSIGNIKLDTKGKIENVRSLYEALNADQKALVTNFDKLMAAEQTLALIIADREIAITVEELINDIGDVLFTQEVKDKIDLARSKYEEITVDQKALVTNYDTLTAKEARYDELRNDNELANQVIALIADIGEVKLEDADKLSQIRQAYDVLTNYQKSLVTNYETLTNAEALMSQILAYKTKAVAVDAKIDQIGDVAYNNEVRDKINSAKIAYSALTKDEKKYVLKAEVLSNAENLYEKIGYVCRTINAIGAVELNKTTKDNISEARKSYDALSDDEKNLIVNYDRLLNAEAEYKQLQDGNVVSTIITIIVIFLIVILVIGGIAYLLIFFVFNSWALIKYKPKRVFQIGNKDGKIRILQMNFKVSYRDPADIHKSKIK